MRWDSTSASWFPSAAALRADMGQSRGAQSGEADRQAVWLEAHGLEPKMSPFDPMAILDEIQRLVPGYDVSRINLLAGNDQHTAIAGERSGSAASHPDLIAPCERRIVHFRNPGTLFAHFEFRNRESAPQPAEDCRRLR